MNAIQSAIAHTDATAAKLRRAIDNSNAEMNRLERVIRYAKAKSQKHAVNRRAAVGLLEVLS